MLVDGPAPMTSWREKNDQELTAVDIREMRAAAMRLPRRVVELQNETVEQRNAAVARAEAAERDVERYALENEILRERLRIIMDRARAVPEAGERAAQMMGNLRESQEWRDGAMMLGLASEVTALRAEIRRMNAEHPDALRQCPLCTVWLPGGEFDDDNTTLCKMCSKGLAR